MNRLSLLCFALALPLAATACGGSDDEGEDGGAVEGDHSQYVVSTINTSATNKLDIDGNGTPENKVGGLVPTLSLVGIDVQSTIDEAVVTGSAILLADLQTTSFSSSSSTAGFSVYLADSAAVTPAPCTDPTVLTTCGKHLQGTGSFSVAATSPTDTELKGKFSNGKLQAGPGKIAIQIALTGAPITVNLVGARIEISSVTADGIGKGLIGGAVSETELNTNVFPSIQVQLKSVIDRDCGAEAVRVRNADGVCGRNENATFTACIGTGATIVGFFDSAAGDCKVSVEEVKNNPILAPSLASDVTINGEKGVSVVLGFSAKKATFTAP